MTLIKWKPIKPMLFNEIDSLFDSISSDFPSFFEGNSSWMPRFEVLNSGRAYSIRADLPGMIKKDINIEVVNNTLTISGERINDYNDNDQYNYSEMNYGKFSRSFNLPEDARENKIQASMKDGVLALQIPRVKPIKPEVKKITIK